MKGISIAENPVHLGRRARAEIEPPFTGDPAWYEAYGARHADDGVEGRLVSLFTFDASWDAWEVHPNGSELVLCTAGEMTLHQEKGDGTTATVVLTPGRYAINEPGTWHTADVQGGATALFITAGLGTRHRPR